MFENLGLAIAMSLAPIPSPKLVPPPDPAVVKLIGQLSDKDFKVRESAGKALEARGEGVLSTLRRAEMHPDPEVRKRLTELVARIERAVLLTPKLLTLHMDQKPASAVFAEISKQTGYKLQIQGGGPQPIVSVNVENQPFWQVLDMIGKQSGLALQQYYDGSNALMFARQGQNANSQFVNYQGAFRLQAASFHYSKTMNLGQGQPQGLFSRSRNETLTFYFNVIGEPKVPLLSLGQVKVTSAVDDLDTSLVLMMPRNNYYGHETYYYGYRNTMMQQTQVQLAGHGAARLLKHIKGTLPVTILAEQRPEIVVEDILKVKNKKFEGGQISLNIDEVKDGPGKQVHVRATVNRTGADANANDYTWMNTLHQRVELQDDKGNKFSASGFNWDSGSPTSVQGTFMFNGDNKVGKAAKLVYYGWITTQHQIDFEFKDLPLP